MSRLLWVDGSVNGSAVTLQVLTQCQAEMGPVTMARALQQLRPWPVGAVLWHWHHRDMTLAPGTGRPAAGGRPALAAAAARQPGARLGSAGRHGQCAAVGPSHSVPLKLSLTASLQRPPARFKPAAGANTLLNGPRVPPKSFPAAWSEASCTRFHRRRQVTLGMVGKVRMFCRGRQRKRDDCGQMMQSSGVT